MSNINFELNLNKHPKDIPNRALSWAENVQVSDDLSCLQTEFSIKERAGLSDDISDKYIAGYIPCNKEFILFLAPKDYKTHFDGGGTFIQIEIYRYKEKGDNAVNNFDNAEGYICYNKFNWHGGKLKGTFTYNIKSHLIIAVAESNTITGEYIPLKTINLGSYGDDNTSTDTDLMLKDSQLSLNPELRIPAIDSFDYINGLAYKGWYYFFIRYKINNTDYTKWYDVGYPIFVDELERVQIFNYFLLVGNALQPSDIYKAGFGAIDYISSGSNTCNKTLSLTFNHNNNNTIYKQYQIGVICSTKTDKRAFKSLDILTTENNFVLNIGSLETYDINSLIFQKYNYYDVKNIINYKNRLYISNYKENIIDYNALVAAANDIQLNISRSLFEYATPDDITYKDINVNAIWKIDGYTMAQGNGITITKNDNTKQITISTQFTNSQFGAEDIIKLLVPIYDSGGTSDEIEALEDTVRQTLNGDWLFPVRKDAPYNEYVLHIEITKDTSSFTITQIDEDTYSLNGTIAFTYTIQSEYIEPEITPEDNYHTRLKNSTLIPGNTYNFYVHFVNKYGEYTEGIKLTNIESQSYIVVNSDGSVKIKNIYNSKYYNSSKIYIYNLEIKHLNNVSLDNYIGCFLTYERVQKTVQFCGVFTRYDFPYIIDDTDKFEKAGFIYYSNINKFKDPVDNKYRFRFYCNEIDVVDVLELNFTQILIEKTGCFPNVDARKVTKGNSLTETTEYDVSCNSLETFGAMRYTTYNIKNAHYVAAHNFSKGNDYRGSYIEIEIENASSFLNSNSPDLFKAVLLAEENNLYLSENKVLIKFTNTFYFDTVASTVAITKGLPGFCTFNTALIYNNNKLILNTGFNVFVNSAYYSYINSTIFKIDGQSDDKTNSEVYIPGICYARYIDYNNYMFESKCFNVLPEIISTRSEAITDSESQAVFQFINSTVVQPMNSINLFKNNFGSQDENAIITYVNHLQEYVSIFDKRIIRSNPIADESFENAWRTFSPEAYKDITENKGNITNLIALGTTLLVHTEHSLFMFDRDNTLQNGEGGSMQLAMPDIFDVDYKEVFASQLGACGLQDSEAWILDEFGYIFYDNDDHGFYRFGAKKVEVIDSSICQYINKYKPYQVRFVNDSESGRILVNIQSQYFNEDGNITNDELTLSYNYRINKWISSHDYVFDRGFSTKQMTYFIIDFETQIDDEIHSTSKLYLINRTTDNFQNTEVIQNLEYSNFENTRLGISEYKMANIAIVVNDTYELIKTIEHITWKLYKISKVNNENTRYNNNPREKLITPYSGYKLRIYNDEIDTGLIDIQCDDIIVGNKVINRKNTSVMNYKKPWWEYGNWNFNYLRNIKNIINRKADFMSRLYGNYFIIQIWFGDITQRVEFETLNCKLTNNPTI